MDSFWCMWMVMQVSKLVRWIFVNSVRSVIMTISRRIASVFFMFLDMMDLSVRAWTRAACSRVQHASAQLAQHSLVIARALHNCCDHWQQRLAAASATSLHFEHLQATPLPTLACSPFVPAHWYQSSCTQQSIPSRGPRLGLY